MIYHEKVPAPLVHWAWPLNCVCRTLNSRNIPIVSVNIFHRLWEWCGSKREIASWPRSSGLEESRPEIARDDFSWFLLCFSQGLLIDEKVSEALGNFPPLLSSCSLRIDGDGTWAQQQRKRGKKISKKVQVDGREDGFSLFFMCLISILSSLFFFLSLFLYAIIYLPSPPHAFNDIAWH